MGVILLWVGVFPRESQNPVGVALVLVLKFDGRSIRPIGGNDKTARSAAKMWRPAR
eukprot:SAG25_NODE_5_length_29351_cov_43.404335_35_plen_56_part_00